MIFQFADVGGHKLAYPALGTRCTVLNCLYGSHHVVFRINLQSISDQRHFPPQLSQLEERIIEYMFAADVGIKPAFLSGPFMAGMLCTEPFMDQPTRRLRCIIFSCRTGLRSTTNRATGPAIIGGAVFYVGHVFTLLPKLN